MCIFGHYSVEMKRRNDHEQHRSETERNPLFAPLLTFRWTITREAAKNIKNLHLI